MKDTNQTVAYKRLSQNAEYYNNVFKKSEKISSVVLYVLSFKKDNQELSLIEKSLTEKSFKLHEASLKSLEAVEGQTASLYPVQQALIALMSTLRVAVASRAIPESLVTPVIEQIDTVQRYLANHHLGSDVADIDSLHDMTIESTVTSAAAKPAAAPVKKTPAAPRQKRVAVPSGDISSDAYLVYSQLNDRTERIKTVLEAKPQASVKDIAEIITDVSEKTIQRDLNSLIDKGQVVREGERRWSRYSVVKD